MVVRRRGLEAAADETCSAAALLSSPPTAATAQCPPSGCCPAAAFLLRTCSRCRAGGATNDAREALKQVTVRAEKAEAEAAKWEKEAEAATGALAEATADLTDIRAQVAPMLALLAAARDRRDAEQRIVKELRNLGTD